MLLRARNQDGISTSSPNGRADNSFSIKANAYASVGACMKARRDDPPLPHDVSPLVRAVDVHAKAKPFGFCTSKSHDPVGAGRQQQQVAQTQLKSQIRARRERDE